VTTPRRLLTIGHAYCVRRNRELADAIAVAGGDAWSVTVVAPQRFPGDMGPIVTRAEPGERAELRLVPVHRARWIHVMTYGRAVGGLLDAPWDLVHCWEEPYVLSTAQIARSCHPDSKFVFASFQNVDKRYPPPFSALERYAVGRSQGWIAFGQSIAETLEGRPGYAERPHAVIPFGVDVARFTPDESARREIRRTLNWDADGAPVVGYLGRFIEAKGLVLLLDTLRQLDRRQVAWRALFVGGGPLEAQLRTFGDEHPGRVQVVTGVAHDEVSRYLRAMDVLCAPSRTTPGWREQFGRMIVEALACGVSVIGSDSGEIPHVIGDAGLVVKEDDRSAWTEALATLLTDPAARRDFASRGRARAEAEFAWPVVAARHLTFFERLLNT